LELKVYALFLRRWVWAIGLAALAAAGLAMLFESRQAPVYASSTTILVSQSLPTRSGPDFETLQTRERLAKTYAELLLKRPVLEAATRSLGLQINPGLLAQRVAVTIIPDTELMVLTVRDSDAQRAADIANAIAHNFPTIEGQLLGDPYAVSRQTLYVVEEAQPNGIPISPNIPRALLLAALAGALMATGGAYLYDYFNDRVASPAAVMRATGLPTVATIGVLKGSEPTERLLMSGKAALPQAEAYRMVRSALECAERPAAPIRTLVIASGVPQEGRSTTAANLAVALAQTGKHVILVDADLRRPTLHRFFQRANTSGLTTALLHHGRDSAAGYLSGTDVDGLRLMAAGPVLPNAVSYLGSARMAELVDELKGMAEIVLFDTPALLSVVDAQLVIRCSDAVLLVANARSTREGDLARAAQQLQAAGASIVGVLLNEARRAEPYAQHYANLKGDDAIELIDFARAVGDRQTEARGGRSSEHQRDRS
jgi:non-specific protein-tyrosine kinase